MLLQEEPGPRSRFTLAARMRSFRYAGVGRPISNPISKEIPIPPFAEFMLRAQQPSFVTFTLIERANKNPIKHRQERSFPEPINAHDCMNTPCETMGDSARSLGLKELVSLNDYGKLNHNRPAHLGNC